jgi:ABC-2 type transport system ATP-binding protein
MMIEVEHLTKYFGQWLAVDDVSFQVDRRQVVGFLGPNGAGKTTTMRILTGYLPASSGSARVAGFDVRSQSLDVRRNIGFLPESVPLYGEMRVEEYVLFRAKLKGVPRKDRGKRVDYCLERCRLREVRRRLLSTLSKGYRQRVGLADAMVHDPALLILDEPTSGLDPGQIRETLTLIRELGEERTVLLSTHILQEVEAICERVILIASGSLRLDRSLSEINSESVTHVEVQAPAEAIAETFKPLASELMLKVQPDGWVHAELEGRDDCRTAIGQAILKRGWPLRRLERKRRSLEEVYFDVVRGGLREAPEGPLPSGSKTTAIQPASRIRIVQGRVRRPILRGQRQPWRPGRSSRSAKTRC